MKVKRIAYVLALSGAVIAMGLSSETAGEYVAPSDAIPRGTAPRMKVALLNSKDSTKEYAVIFYQGDEAFSGLQELAEKYL